jgi:hypothetical protein
MLNDRWTDICLFATGICLILTVVLLVFSSPLDVGWGNGNVNQDPLTDAVVMEMICFACLCVCGGVVVLLLI